MEEDLSSSDVCEIKTLTADTGRCSGVRTVLPESENAAEKHLSNQKGLSLIEKFEELKKRAHDIRSKSKAKLLKTEKKRTTRLLKKALKDPYVKSLVDNKELPSCESSGDEPKVEWKDVKPYLTINSHLQGPVSHGWLGPKTEVEAMIDKCIEEGDLEKAEILSDTLANKQFAVKISEAFAAQRYAQQLLRQKAEVKARKSRKIRLGFAPKERWQMKGNL